MKVIDLLNKMSNDDNYKPTFKHRNSTYKYNVETKYYEPSFMGLYKLYMILNNEVEIIEEQDELIPKHLTNGFIQGLDKYMTKQDIKHIAHKVNEIINYLQHKSKED